MGNVISVSALNSYVKSLLEHDTVLTDIAIRGEISNFVNHFKTGHFYFSLKDEKCSVKAVMFRGNAQAVGFLPQNGMRVIVQCRISLFERDGSFQVYVDHMVPDGIGAMQLAFEQLKQRLDAEGLFDPAHKKMLPSVPKCVGLVTSKTGAAIQDIFNVTRRRYPLASFLLAPVTVQGEDSAPGIAQAISMLDSSNRVDVIIVARGGGSREDLWVFNDERIARAAYASQTPVVSAIGHEIDFSILDFVSDLRAPTPSAAAEIVMPDLAAEFAAARKTYANIDREIQKKLNLCYNKLIDIHSASVFSSVSVRPQLELQLLAGKAETVKKALHLKMQNAEARLAHAATLSTTLNPQAVLARGYSILRKEDSVVKSIDQIKSGDTVYAQISDGVLACTVNESRGNV